MEHDSHVADRMSKGTIRLSRCIHLREEADGGALVVGDRTLTAAYINRPAHVLFKALGQPCALGDLARILADTVHCPVSEAFVHVAKLVENATRLDWIETHNADMGP